MQKNRHQTLPELGLYLNNQALIKAEDHIIDRRAHAPSALLRGLHICVVYMAACSESALRVSLTYLTDLPEYELEKPYEVWVPVSDDVPKSNCHFTEHHDIPVHNVRDYEHYSFTLDTFGFQYLSHESQCLPDSKIFTGPDGHKSVAPYLEETAQLVKDTLGARKVLTYDWRYRKNTAPWTAKSKALGEYSSSGDRRNAIEPANIVHIDESIAGGAGTLKVNLTDDEWQDYLKGDHKVMLVNVWRSLLPVVEDAPLSVCDRRSIEEGDLAACDMIRANILGEEYFVRYRPSHKWYWMENQTSTEPVLFLTWESNLADVGTAVGPPHVAFKNPLARSDAPTRESIEVRLIVFMG